ncbi:hypothetical protein HAX54_002131 [Datura stramonium]|uniref:Transmembrane protein n=1 Tax=Datura stramonium TaxID=4076 RepID=A0ABS8T4Z6_DATST|nr:hypothetical protein [Datura stramonium]
MSFINTQNNRNIFSSDKFGGKKEDSFLLILEGNFSGIFKSYLATSYDNRYNNSKLLAELEILTLCNIDISSYGDVVLHGVRILYFYTQWTFTLVTVYFGLGSSLSIHGCLQSRKGGSGVSANGVVDTERGTYTAPVPENASVLIVSNGLNSHGEPHVTEAADSWGLAFQIIFQMTAGAVVLTDCVFWLVIYPFLTDKNYKLHFLAVCMHSVNAICLLGDVFLNRLRFPFFRIAYFVLWTCMFVTFQWILHIFVSLRWPYPFLDLSSQYAPLWYFAVGILHLPCYGMFAILIRIKKYWLPRLFHSPMEMYLKQCYERRSPLAVGDVSRRAAVAILYHGEAKSKGANGEKGVAFLFF